MLSLRHVGLGLAVAVAIAVVAVGVGVCVGVVDSVLWFFAVGDCCSCADKSRNTSTHALHVCL